MTDKHSKKAFASLLAVLLLSGLVAGCGGGSGGSGGLSGEFPSVRFTGSLSGYIKVPVSSRSVEAVSSTPLANAAVTCSNRQDITDENGYFQILYLPVGKVVCTVSKSGYSTTTFSAVVSQGINSVVSAPVYITAAGSAILVDSFSPASGATGVSSDGTVFKVIFTGSLSTSINLNTQATLTASGFSITIQKTGGSTLTINSSNALNYGTFSYTTTSVSNDTLSFTLKPSATLTSSGLKTLKSGTAYSITSRTPPSNLAGASGESVNVSTGVPSTGSFTTQ